MASLQVLANSSPPPPHIVLLPFMSKGHTIPILHLARLLLRRGITVTIFTTPSNAPFITHSLLHHPHLTILTLPFPQNLPDLPPGVESTDKLPSISLFQPFASATKLMKPHFDLALHTLQNVSAIVSDGFLPWTLASAQALGVPRLVFYGMTNYSMALSRAVVQHHLIETVNSDDEPFTVPTFPWIKLTRNDFEPPFNDPNPKGPLFEFVIETGIATANSQGIIINGFYELEPTFVDHMNKAYQPKSWCVGPLSLAVEQHNHKYTNDIINNKWMQWLNDKDANGNSVLYVAFGSQAEISKKQMKEIATGLEKSGVSFMWVMRTSSSSSATEEDENYELWFEGFEERVRERGVVVREWVEQVEVLRHEGVKGFMSHCGWNSVVESVCAAVPVVAWPMMAEQHLNARMVVEELGIGVRVVAENGSVRGFMKAEKVEEAVRELMEGEKGKEARKKVKELGEMARKAVEEGGSSWRSLNAMLQEICGKKI